MSDESEAGPPDSGPKQDQKLEEKCILKWTIEDVKTWLELHFPAFVRDLDGLNGTGLATLTFDVMDEIKVSKILKSSLLKKVGILLRSQKREQHLTDGQFNDVMEERGTPVQSAAAPANDGGTGIGDLSAKVNQLTECVKSLTVVMTKNETPSLTRTLAGAKEWENAIQKIDFHDISDGTSDGFLTEDIGSVAEDQVMANLFPKIGHLVNNLNIGLEVVDSETAQWLPQGSNHYQRYDLKPDGFVILEAFTDAVDKGLGFLKGKPALKSDLFMCMRSIIEGKAVDAHGNEALGQAKLYAEKLQEYIPVLHVLLIDRAKFRACRFRGSNLISAISGELNQKGSAVFIQKFLLGAAESLNEKNYDKQYCAVSPRVTALETVTRESLRYWKENQSLEFSSVLGKGMTGIVLQLRRPASSNSASLGRGVYAAKISHPDFSPQVRQEIYNYQSLKNVNDTQKCFATLLHSQSTECYTTILTQPVGQPWDRQNSTDVESALKALLNFHALGFVHGDARVANIRKKQTGDGFFLIDFAELVQTFDSASRRADLGIFFCSVLRKDPERRQGWTNALGKRMVEKINSTYPLGENVHFDDSAVEEYASELATSIFKRN